MNGRLKGESNFFVLRLVSFPAVTCNRHEEQESRCQSRQRHDDDDDDDDERTMIRGWSPISASRPSDWTARVD